MNVGERIKNRRKELGMTVDDLAKKVGKSRATIYRYENGSIEKLPTDVLVPFAEALDLDPDYLMGWSEKRRKKYVLKLQNIFYITHYFLICKLKMQQMMLL